MFAALLTALQQAAGEVMERSFQHSRAADHEAASLEARRRREEKERERRLRHATRLSPVEKALTAAAVNILEKNEDGNAAEEDSSQIERQNERSRPSDTPGPDDSDASAFEIGGIVREKMVEIQRLKRVLDAKDAKLAEAGDLTERYQRAVRVAELACGQLKALEVKLEVASAEIWRLKAADAGHDSKEATVEDAEADDDGIEDVSRDGGEAEAA